MVLLAMLIPPYIFITYMTEDCAEKRLTLFFPLLGAISLVVLPADVGLDVSDLGLLCVLHGEKGHTLASPLRPDLRQVICAEEWVAVLPIEGVSP